MRNQPELPPPFVSIGGMIAALSKEYVIVANIGGDHRLLFKVLFGSQGDLYVPLPNFTPLSAILGHYFLPGHGESTAQFEMRVDGYTTSRNIKYSHHVSGVAQFSGDPKLVRTLVRTPSVPLADAEGHLFTIQVKGSKQFQPATREKDRMQSDPKRTVVDFGFNPATFTGAQFVGLWKRRSRLGPRPEHVASSRSHGPVVSFDIGFGPMPTYLIAPPPSCQFGNRILLLSCVPEDIPSPGHESLLLMYGGFDPREIVLDLTRDSTIIAAKYPPSAAELPLSLPSIDVEQRTEESAA